MRNAVRARSQPKAPLGPIAEQFRPEGPAEPHRYEHQSVKRLRAGRIELLVGDQPQLDEARLGGVAVGQDDRQRGPDRPRLGAEHRDQCGKVSNDRRTVADSDDPGRLFRSDPGHYSEVMPVGRSQIEWL